MSQQTESSESFIHGKQLEKIECGELINFLKSTHESPLIEFKEGVGDKNKLRKLILRSLVAFLNGEAKGYLIIGVGARKRLRR
jgi:predicted HTH transcriptional regulator